MSSIDRRTFLAFGGGAVALTTLPLAGCGGGDGSSYPPVSAAPNAPMAAADGVQYRTVAKSHVLVINTANGTQRVVGGAGLGQGYLNAPEGVAILGGLAYVVEKGNHRVQVFNSTGTVMGSFGEGVLLYPGGIAAGASEIFVSDSRNARIVAFRTDGSVSRIIGAGVLSAPRGLQVLDDGLLVADPGLRKVVKLGFDGRILAEYGSGWVLPWDAVTDGNLVYVADVSRNELGVASLGGGMQAPIALAAAPANVWYRNGSLYVRSYYA